MPSTIPMPGTGSAPGLMAAAPSAGPPTNPINFLIAAADKSSGADPHRSIPTGHSKALQTGAKPSRAAIKVIK